MKNEKTKKELGCAIFSTNVFLRRFPISNLYLVRPRAVMADGFSVSIQATEYTYCTPAMNHARSYTDVELGFPSEEDKLINEYTEYLEDDTYTDTVYPYVPVEIVDKLIEKHGGIVAVEGYHVDHWFK